MPWLGPYPDAPDTHKMWADEGSTLAAALRASGYRVAQSAPGSGEQDSAADDLDGDPPGVPRDEIE